jgi:DNA-binding transcriptional LysR family regulator
MNLKNLAYFLEVTKDMNMTSAAQRLYISQQALSLQIKKLEQYYHVPLFERHPKLQLTYAGSVLAESASAILKENEDVINRLSSLSDNHFGSVHIGISAVRATLCLPMVLPKFSQKWPNITLKLTEKTTDEALTMLYEGELDILIAPVQGQSERQILLNRVDFTFLINEKTYVICSDVLLKRYFGNRAEEVKASAKNGVDLREFSDVPFILHKSPMMIRRLADECFHMAGFKPKIYIESNNTDLIISMYPCHLGVFFCRGTRLPTLLGMFPDCNAFPVTGADFLSDTPIYLMRNKDQKLSAHMVDFVEIMKETWQQLYDY